MNKMAKKGIKNKQRPRNRKKKEIEYRAEIRSKMRVIDCRCSKKKRCDVKLGKLRVGQR